MLLARLLAKFMGCVATNQPARPFMILGSPVISKNQRVYRSILNQYEHDNICLSKNPQKIKFSIFVLLFVIIWMLVENRKLLKFGICKGWISLSIMEVFLQYSHCKNMGILSHISCWYPLCVRSVHVLWNEVYKLNKKNFVSLGFDISMLSMTRYFFCHTGVFVAPASRKKISIYIKKCVIYMHLRYVYGYTRTFWL